MSSTGPMRTLLGSLRANRDGSALIEGALVVPVLIFLLFGVYEFSWYFYQKHVMMLGVRDAARYLARSATPCDPDSPTWVSDEQRAKNLAVTGAVDGGALRVNGWTSQFVRTECEAIANSVDPDGQREYRGGASLLFVTISTRFVDPSLGFFSLLGLRAPTIFISHSERAVGPG